MNRPIPAFYCVYLLRSSIRPSCPRDFYIGSTPDPCRRQKQHNGIATGGAKRTEQSRKRPWKMCLVISGFSSKISALQFEWAWQHTYKTRFVKPEMRAMVTQGIKRTKINKNGLRFAKTQDPSRRLPALMNDLHVLMSSSNFSRLPLSLRFLQQDVYKQWGNTSLALRPQLANGSPCISTRQHSSVREVIPSEETVESGKNDGIDSLDVSYASYERPILKSMSRLSNRSRMFCTLCFRELEGLKQLSLFCPLEGCEMSSHVTCLAEHFLRQEENKLDVIPIHGSCPSCKRSLKWSELVRELSLRLRGHKNVEKLVTMGKGGIHTRLGPARVSLLDEVEEPCAQEEMS